MILCVKFVFWSAAIKVAACEKSFCHGLNDDPFVNNAPFVVVVEADIITSPRLILPSLIILMPAV